MQWIATSRVLQFIVDIKHYMINSTQGSVFPGSFQDMTQGLKRQHGGSSWRNKKQTNMMYYNPGRLHHIDGG